MFAKEDFAEGSSGQLLVHFVLVDGIVVETLYALYFFKSCLCVLVECEEDAYAVCC